jgi:hypothetical protein
VAITKTGKKKPTKPKADSDKPKAAEGKKRGATGTTWGLNVGQTWLKMLEDNRKKKLVDIDMVEFMCAEFPNNKEYTVEDIRLHRNLFNRGRIRDQDPFGIELEEGEKLHEYAEKDGKKTKLPLRAVRKKGAKKKKPSTEDVPEEPDFDDEDEEEEETPKRTRRKGRKA